MWSDRMLRSCAAAQIDNSAKAVRAGQPCQAVIGTRELGFIDDSPTMIQLDIGCVSGPTSSAQPRSRDQLGDRVDLTGQVCADSIGRAIITGVGGQMDFIRSAALSRAASRHRSADPDREGHPADRFDFAARPASSPPPASLRRLVRRRRSLAGPCRAPALIAITPRTAGALMSLARVSSDAEPPSTTASNAPSPRAGWQVSPGEHDGGSSRCSGSEVAPWCGCASARAGRHLAGRAAGSRGC
jgi:hypothetical protein